MSKSSEQVPVGKIALTSFAGVMLLLAWLVVEPKFGAKAAATLLAVLTVLAGYEIFYEAFAGLFRGQISADLAVAIAAIAALAIRQYYAAAEVIFIMLVGGTLEAFAVGRTRRAIEKLVSIRPTTAKVRRDGKEIEIDVAEVVVGDLVVVRPGERLPVTAWWRPESLPLTRALSRASPCPFTGGRAPTSLPAR